MYPYVLVYSEVEQDTFSKSNPGKLELQKTIKTLKFKKEGSKAQFHLTWLKEKVGYKFSANPQPEPILHRVRSNPCKKMHFCKIYLQCWCTLSRLSMLKMTLITSCCSTLTFIFYCLFSYCRIALTQPVPLQQWLSSTFWNFLHTHLRSLAWLLSTFFFPLFNRKGKYKPAGQPKLKWADLAKNGENKRWFVELIDSWHFIQVPIDAT